MAEEILSTDIWFHFQSIEMMLKKPKGVADVCCHRNDDEEKSRKKGVWQMLSFIFNPLK